MKVLINAYAVSPGMGSEPGMGWNWCVHLARHAELYIITEGEFREKIEAVLPLIPEGRNMHFYYLPVSERIRRMCWNQGDWRFYIHYRKWQKRALTLALQICSRQHIDVIHQLNMIGFREPGYLWKIKGPRFIWGPANCKFEYPFPYWKGASLRSKLAIRLKDLLSRLQLSCSPRVRKASERADTVIVASSDGRALFKKYLGVDCVVINETGAEMPEHTVIDTLREPGPLKLLWIGRLNLYTKLPDLAIKALSLAKADAELFFYGPGDSSSLAELAERLGVGNKCHFVGAVPHEKIMELMPKADALLFTSIVEGTPHVVLEAVSCRLPVLCFDTCGQGDIVTDKIGMKIPVSSPEQSALDFAAAIDKIYDNPAILEAWRKACPEVVRNNLWSDKALKLIEYYSCLC